jgi:hypothetical protein
MIRLVRRLSGEGTLFRRNRLLFIGLAILCTFALFWLLVSKSSLPLTTTDVTQARAGDTLIPLSAKSAGCGKPSPVAPGTSVNQTILSGGITRSYLLHIPRSYLDTTSQALVLDFHGHESSAANQEYLTGFSTLADAHDVIGAYPQGAVGPDHHTGWDTGPRRNPGTNDVLFVSDLLRHLQRSREKPRWAGFSAHLLWMDLLLRQWALPPQNSWASARWHPTSHSHHLRDR